MDFAYLIYIVVIFILYTIDALFDIELEVDIDDTLVFDKEYIIPNITIQSSPIGGRGVFAAQSYKKGDIIEIVPCIRVNNNKINGRITDYTFEYDETTSLVAFGYGSIYNHKTTPNAYYSVLNKCQMEIGANEDINIGEEICINYGDEYFANRYYLEEKFDVEKTL